MLDAFPEELPDPELEPDPLTLEQELDSLIKLQELELDPEYDPEEEPDPELASFELEPELDPDPEDEELGQLGALG